MAILKSFTKSSWLRPKKLWWVNDDVVKLRMIIFKCDEIKLKSVGILQSIYTDSADPKFEEAISSPSLS